MKLTYLGMCPGVELTLDALFWPDPGKVVDDAVVLGEVQVPSASVLVPCDGLGDLKESVPSTLFNS